MYNIYRMIYKKLLILFFIFILITVFLVIFFVNKFISEYLYLSIKTLNDFKNGKNNINKKEYIKYVCNTIKFYKKYKDIELINFPIIYKKNIRENQNNFLNEYVKLLINSKETAQNNWAEKKENNIYSYSLYRLYEFITKVLYNNYAICQITGGSSGQYFYQWYTKDELILATYGFTKCFYNLGWRENDKILLYYAHGANTVKILNYLNSFLYFYNIQSLYPKIINNDLDLNHVLEFINKLNTFKPKLIIAFPNNIFRIAQIILINNIKLDYIPDCMDLSAEYLYECQYNFIKKIFKNCDIRLSYGTVEFGQIAQQTKDDNTVYEVFDEIVDITNNDKNQLIITSYILKTQPLIKYCIDDYGEVYKRNNKTYIKNLIGKKAKCINNNEFSIIQINDIINKINKKELIIIDLKVEYISKKIIIIIIKNLSDKIKRDIEDTFKINIGFCIYNFNFIFNFCGYKKCVNISNYNSKVIPILCK